MSYDAIVIGSGPNGLSAAVELARNGAKTLVVEAAETIGGGTRTKELTLPGYHHDFCSAVHPMGILSPFWKELPLADYGLEWVTPEASVAHPLEGEPAAILTKDVAETAENLGQDGNAWRRMVKPLLRKPEGLLKDALAPLGFPRHPFLLALFGLNGMFPATTYSKLRFSTTRGRAMFAGCAGHSVLPLEKPFSSAVAVIFALTAHMENWPVAKGGSYTVTKALANYFKDLGGEIQTNFRVNSLEQLPDAKVILFDTDPTQLSNIAADALPDRYRNRLAKYNYGPGGFKVDWA
ncbi:MAG: NAD(P)/FAD-dependent oxidoreductase, partial [Chloroflexota bacterium]